MLSQEMHIIASIMLLLSQVMHIAAVTEVHNRLLPSLETLHVS